MKHGLLIGLIVLTIAPVVPGSTREHGRDNIDYDEVYRDRWTLEQTQTRVETVVNRYFIDMLQTQFNLSAAEIEDRFVKIAQLATQNSGSAPLYVMNNWESSINIRLRMLRQFHPQFQTTYPNDVRRALELYHSELTDPENT